MQPTFESKADVPTVVVERTPSPAHAQRQTTRITFAPNLTPCTFPTTTLVTRPAPALDHQHGATPSAALFPPSPTAAPVQRTPHSKRRPENHIPRPPNSFILFRSEFIKNQHVPGTIESNHGSLSKIIGLCWRNLSFEERAIWEARAKAAQAEHKVKYPNYRFRPVHSKDAAGGVKRDKAAGGVNRHPGAAEYHAKEEQKIEDVAMLLLEGKKGDALAVAVKKLERERERARPASSSPAPAAGFLSFTGLPIVKHRRSSSAPLPDSFLSLSRAFAGPPSCPSSPPPSFLYGAAPTLQFGFTAGDVIDMPSPPPLVPRDLGGEPDFSAFTHNPFGEQARDGDFNAGYDAQQLSPYADTAPFQLPFSFESPSTPSYPYDLSSAATPELLDWVTQQAPSPVSSISEPVMHMTPSSLGQSDMLLPEEDAFNYYQWMAMQQEQPSCGTPGPAPASTPYYVLPDASHCGYQHQPALKLQTVGPLYSSAPCSPLEPETKALYKFASGVACPTPTFAYDSQPYLAVNY